MALVLILGDQLSEGIAALAAADRESDSVLMAEVMEEATYVPHHPKKIAFLFSAMRHFVARLREAGWQMDYVTIDDDDNTGSLKGEVARRKPDRVIVTEPGEWRLRDEIEGWAEALGCEVEILEDTRFLCSHARFAKWAEGRKELRMEYFYREMRRKTGLLMEGDDPAGGKWNYDAENRKPAKSDLFLPKPLRFEPDEITAEVLKLVADHFGGNFGDLEPFGLAVTQEDAEKALDTFIADALPSFGDYQDAMLKGEPFLYHSLLSAYLNAGLLDPLDICRRVEKAWKAGQAPLNAAEGFIRQIIGWREYVRGVYWREMPGYRDLNHLGAKRALPSFYWTGKTEMACLREAIGQTKREAYAHHIQRLMVTGNFAMLIGADPREVHEWYLAVYADAYEWVELPNTLGMSQFADGGILGSKPYAASGAYIDRMSDYCSDCAYKVKVKTGEGACPFNLLYWDFLARNEEKLSGNPRMAQMYATWGRMDAEKRKTIRNEAAAFLDALD